MFKFNKINVSIVLALVSILMCACGSGKAERTETVSMYDLRKAMLAADDSLPEMMSAGDTDENAEESFAFLSDFDYDKVEHFFMSYASTDGDTEEIAVIAVKDSSDVEEAKKSLEDHLDSRIKLFTQYEPGKVSELEKGEVFTEEQYAVLIVSDKKDKIKTAFNDFLTNGGSTEQ